MTRTKLAGDAGAGKLEPPKRERLVDGVRRSLEDAILAGQMRPGERLVEQRLSVELAVSRTTVREALLMLERQGLVMSVPRHGTFVTRLSPDDARDLCLVRGLIEGAAVGLRFPLRPETVVELIGYVREMEHGSLPASLPQLVELDIAFHRALVRDAGSPRLFEWWEGLNGQVRALYLTSLEERAVDMAGIVGMHTELVVALTGDDIEAARRATVLHYTGIRGTLAEVEDVLRAAALVR